MTMKTIEVHGTRNGQPIVKTVSQLILGSTKFLRADDMGYIQKCLIHISLQVGIRLTPPPI